MCQAYEGEANYVLQTELDEIHQAWEAHRSGQKPLTEDELRDLAIRKLMLMEE